MSGEDIMICRKCDNDLPACTCPDLKERFESLLKSKFVIVGEDYAKRILAQIARNEAQQSKAE